MVGQALKSSQIYVKIRRLGIQINGVQWWKCTYISKSEKDIVEIENWRSTIAAGTSSSELQRFTKTNYQIYVYHMFYSFRIVE